MISTVETKVLLSVSLFEMACRAVLRDTKIILVQFFFYFGLIFYILVLIFSMLVSCTKKNLAALFHTCLSELINYNSQSG
jgi:hypothetical protein